MFNSRIGMGFKGKEGDDIFAMLSQEERETIDSTKSVNHYKKGEYIYKEGDTPSGMIYLAEGKVKIFKEGIGGREQIIRMVKSNGLVGYRSLICQEQHISSAVAIEDSVVYCIPENILFSVLLKNASFSLMLLRNLAFELGFSNKRTVSLTQKHIRGRLAESLTILVEKYGYENDGTTLKVYLSREDLANLSNMTTSNAIRTLSSFANEKIITIDGRKIRILDYAMLDKISMLG